MCRMKTPETPPQRATPPTPPTPPQRPHNTPLPPGVQNVLILDLDVTDNPNGGQTTISFPMLSLNLTTLQHHFLPPLALPLSHSLPNFILPQDTILLTDGPWDLQHLNFISQTHKIPLPRGFDIFYNIRTEFTTAYPNAPPPVDRVTMLNYLSLPLRLHIPPILLIADIVCKLLIDGHTFSTPQSVQRPTPTAILARQAVHLSPATPAGGIIRLRGLPWTCTRDDVIQFFSPIPIVPNGVHFVFNASGKATGEAFVQLAYPGGVPQALLRHKNNMGKRYVEVFKSSVTDMQSHLSRAEAKRSLALKQQHQHAVADKRGGVAGSVAGSSTGVRREAQMVNGDRGANGVLEDCHGDGRAVDERDVDEGTVDEGTVDEGTVDEGTVDEGTVDEGTVDEGTVDKGTVDKGTVDVQNEGESEAEDESIVVAERSDDEGRTENESETDGNVSSQDESVEVVVQVSENEEGTETRDEETNGGEHKVTKKEEAIGEIKGKKVNVKEGHEDANHSEDASHETENGKKL